MEREVRQQLPDGRTVTLKASSKPKGVRLHHPEFRNCTYVVTMYSRRYPTPYPCKICRVRHRYKCIHLLLDEHGNVVINDVLYDHMKADGILGVLEATKEVTPRPFAIGIGRGMKEVFPANVANEERLIKANGLMVRGK